MSACHALLPTRPFEHKMEVTVTEILGNSQILSIFVAWQFMQYDEIDDEVNDEINDEIVEKAVGFLCIC